MKKVIATILTIITALCFAIGIAGCKGCGDKEVNENVIVCKKDFGTPIGATVWESYESRSTLIKEDEKQLKYIYSYFKSVKYRYTDELSEQESALVKKFTVLF